MLQTQEIPLNLIDETDYHQRFSLDEESLAGLRGSIAKLGLLVPLIVRPHGERYDLVAGRRRRQCLLDLGRETAPCIVRTGSVDDARRSAIADNLMRSEPTPIETAVAIAKALESGESQVAEIAGAMHRTPDWVRQQVAMLDWPDDVLQVLHAGQLSVAAASNLAEIDNDPYRAFLLENATANGATARTTAAWLQAYRASLPAPEALQAQPAPPGSPAPALIPQAPCLCCGVTHRVDELSHVSLCARCIPAVRRLGLQAGT